MKITSLEEAGYEQALKGIAISFYDHKSSFKEFWTTERRNKAIHRSEHLAFLGGGHNKFLASMFTWWLVQAPRTWWSEYDTYKVATTANSASTMHTLDKRPVTIDDFEEGTSMEAIDTFNRCLAEYKDITNPYYKDITRLKLNLPEGWLQERIICINYMTIQNIIKQRTGHRLQFWEWFIQDIVPQLDHPELVIPKDKLNPTGD